MDASQGLVQWVGQLFERGGILMYPIAACAILALGILIERWVALQRNRVAPRTLMASVLRLVRERKYGETESTVAAHDSSVAALIQVGIKHRGRRREVLRDAFEEAGRQELAYLERHVGALGTIANVAPLLGLLGTVAGMIQAFQQVVVQVAQESSVDPGHLASGIWAALITTAAGLTVAIPAFLAFRFLQSRIDRYAVEMEDFSLQLVDLLERRDDQAPEGPARAEAQGEPREAE